MQRMSISVCKEPLGLPPYGKIKASTYRKNADSCQPDDGNILSHKGWCARKKKGKSFIFELEIVLNGP